MSTRRRRGRDAQAEPGQGRRRLAGPRDGDVPQPGGLGSAATAAGRARWRRQRPGGAVQLPYLLGSLPPARGHRQLRPHVSALASGRPRGRAPPWGGLRPPQRSPSARELAGRGVPRAAPFLPSGHVHPPQPSVLPARPGRSTPITPSADRADLQLCPVSCARSR